MKRIYLIIILCITMASYTRSQDNNQKLEEYAVPAFNGIDAGSLSNVYITIGSPQSLKIEKDEDEDRTTIFKVKDSILEIKHTTDGENLKLNNEKIYITCPVLNYLKVGGVSRAQSQDVVIIKAASIYISGSGASKIDLNIDTKKLKTDASGATKITLKGNALQHISNMSGAAKINAKELNVNEMEVKGSGVAKAEVNVKSKISGQLSGLSTVHYEKSPDTVLTNNNTLSRNNMPDDMGVINIDKDVNSISNAKKDTTKVSILGSGVEVVDGEDTRISIGNTEMIVDKKGSVHIKKKDSNKNYVHHFHGHWAGFELAYNGYVDKNLSNAIPSQYAFLELNRTKSVGVNINLFELNANIINNRFGLVSGIGIQWNNFRFDRDVVLLPDSGRIYGYHNTNINSYLKSKLVECWVRVPLFLEYQTAKRKWKQFHVAVGGVFGYKIDSHSKQVNYEGGERNYDKIYNDFYLNPVKLDGEVRIGWGPINLFASYSFTQMFEKNKGPELYPYMIGITLASW
ncbi:MAG: DUF2807 domain-containing protein [Bacteroidetes bacterium]|nr:DUF2807 domain-containing protein [Bacteroidota bacterium]